MTIQKERQGFISFCCDDSQCQEIYETAHDTFHLALAEAKRYGWRAIQVCGEWMHFCKDCKP